MNRSIKSVIDFFLKKAIEQKPDKTGVRSTKWAIMFDDFNEMIYNLISPQS